MWGILFAFVLLCSSVLYCAAKGTDTIENLYANAAVLMDADSGRVLYGKNADEVLPMASTTKIMTCILVLEMMEEGESAEVSAYAQSMPKVRLGVRKGETYLVEDLLYSLMLESHNDSAVVLAEHFGTKLLESTEKSCGEHSREESRKAVAAFAEKMNEKAAELGLTKTYFITPNGLDASEEVETGEGMVLKEHATTARELAQIMIYCIKESPKKDDFVKITKTKSYSFTANKRRISCANHNSLMNMMEGVGSGKTGFTNKAGYCYVGTLERDGKSFVVALLACGWPGHKSWKWTDSKKLLQYGLDHYQYHSFAADSFSFDAAKLPDIPVVGARTMAGDRVAACKVSVDFENAQGIEGLLLNEGEEVRMEYSLQKVLRAPVEEGTVVGKLYYMVDDVVYRQNDLVAEQSVPALDLPWCIRVTLQYFLLLGME